VPRLERFILTKSSWDTGDVLAKLVGEVFRSDTWCRNLCLGKWRSSENLWLRRSAILFQLGYKAEADAALLFAIVSKNADSKEFFIQKASGWALREYAKTDARNVEAFVKLPRSHRSPAVRHSSTISAISNSTSFSSPNLEATVQHPAS
jgi:3-methyladenine DNA glycosylase AlkD